jgi:hypothetical protein
MAEKEKTQEEPQSDPQAAGGSLLEDTPMEEPATEELAPEETTVDHVAKEPGDDAETPPIPEGVPDKFVKDGEVDVDGLAKSYTELEGKFRAGKHKAPDGDYDLMVAKDHKVPEDDPVLQTYATWAKEAGISQEHFDQLAEQILQNGEDTEQQVVFDRDAEMKRLGPQADKIIDDQIDWARRLVKSGYWGEDDFEEFKVWGGTASGVKAMMSMRRFYNDITTIPVNVSPDASALPSKEECYQMVQDPKYKTDPAYRAKVEKTFAAVFGTEPDHRMVM